MVREIMVSGPIKGANNITGEKKIKIKKKQRKLVKKGQRGKSKRKWKISHKENNNVVKTQLQSFRNFKIPDAQNAVRRFDKQDKSSSPSTSQRMIGSPIHEQNQSEVSQRILHSRQDETMRRFMNKSSFYFEKS